MSAVAENAGETAAEVVEEAVDGVVDVVEVVRNNPVTLALVGVAGLAVGAGGGYFVARKLLRSYYEDLASQEIAEAKEHYASLNKVTVDGEPLTPQQVLENIHGSEAAVDSLRAYQGRQIAEAVAEGGELEHPLDEEDERQINRLEQAQKTEEVETRNIFDPHFDYTEEIKHRRPDTPYIITHDEYFEAEKDYDTQSLTYYEDDDTLVDEHDKPIDDLTIVNEDHLVRFGHGSKDKNIVYVRNDKLETDYEIVLAKGSFLEAMGLGPEPNELKHSAQRDRRRAFKHGDG